MIATNIGDCLRHVLACSRGALAHAGLTDSCNGAMRCWKRLW